jgi:hypothetical protein
MPPLAEQLTKAVTELRNLREVLDQLKDLQSKDHDDQIRLKKDIESAVEKITVLEQGHQELSFKLETCLKEMQAEFVDTIKEQANTITKPLEEKIKELKEVNQEKRSKKWDIVLIFISAFITAIAAIIIARTFSVPEHDSVKPKATSSIHFPVGTNEGRLLWASK